MTENIPSKIEYGPIAAEIEEMYRADQEAIRRNLDSGNMKSGQNKELILKHTERLKEIVAEIGWPTISKVGEVVANKAWLLVQHADHDVEFQKHCLQLMEAEPKGEVLGKNVAYLEDRVRANEGRPQLYGTQFSGDTEESYGPKPIEDPEHVDERRAELGMEPLAEYKEALIKIFFKKK